MLEHYREALEYEVLVTPCLVLIEPSPAVMIVGTLKETTRSGRRCGCRPPRWTAAMADQADLGRRLEQAEATLEALRSGEVDAIVGIDHVMLVRLREVEQALRASEGRYQALIGSIDQGFCVIEVLLDDAGRGVD